MDMGEYLLRVNRGTAAAAVSPDGYGLRSLLFLDDIDQHLEPHTDSAEGVRRPG
jgi:hypothetical protein